MSRRHTPSWLAVRFMADSASPTTATLTFPAKGTGRCLSYVSLDWICWGVFFPCLLCFFAFLQWRVFKQPRPSRQKPESGFRTTNFEFRLMWRPSIGKLRWFVIAPSCMCDARMSVKSEIKIKELSFDFHFLLFVKISIFIFPLWKYLF